MPDVFVPLDTTMGSTYYSNLLRKGVLNDFTRHLLITMQSIENNVWIFVSSEKNLLWIQKFMGDFFAFAEKQGVAKDSAGLASSEALIKLQLKALVARNLWDTDAYFEVIKRHQQCSSKSC